MSERYLKIIRLNGDEHIIGADTAYKVRDFVVPSPSLRVSTETVDGLDGHLDMGADYEPRELTAVLQMYSYDAADYPLKRNELFNILRSKEQFYLIDSREAGKRWKVRADGFSLDQLSARAGETEVTFTAESAYSESIGTTLDPLTFDAELWQIGQSISNKV